MKTKRREGERGRARRWGGGAVKSESAAAGKGGRKGFRRGRRTRRRPPASGERKSSEKNAPASQRRAPHSFAPSVLASPLRQRPESVLPLFPSTARAPLSFLASRGNQVTPGGKNWEKTRPPSNTNHRARATGQRRCARARRRRTWAPRPPADPAAARARACWSTMTAKQALCAERKALGPPFSSLLIEDAAPARGARARRAGLLRLGRRRRRTRVRRLPEPRQRRRRIDAAQEAGRDAHSPRGCCSRRRRRAPRQQQRPSRGGGRRGERAG